MQKSSFIALLKGGGAVRKRKEKETIFRNCILQPGKILEEDDYSTKKKHSCFGFVTK